MTDKFEQLTNVYYQLIDKAHEARAASYCPYSGIAVGAALLTAGGRIYLGANIENASFSPTICAERVAFFKAINAGERDFVAIAVVGAKKEEEPSANFPPCGVCRQVMSEFCGPDFMIVLGTRDKFDLIPFSDILPYSFTKDNFDSQAPEALEDSAEPDEEYDDLDEEYEEYDEYSDEEEDYDDEPYGEEEEAQDSPEYPIVEEFCFGEE